MVRIKTNVASKRRKKRVLKATKGQFGQRSRDITQAKRSLIKGLVYQFRDRRVKKREFKSLWIIRINAACQEEGIMYSRFVKGLKDANIIIDRKVLSELAISDPAVFKKLVEIAQEKLANTAATTKKTIKKSE
ncbi:MAG: 50S ribosomal protein L20 [Candidatus Zapsychrus exili]|nr:50S ribosomal protein L20 [Candidatus Zapsychrus exili]